MFILTSIILNSFNPINITYQPYIKLLVYIVNISDFILKGIGTLVNTSVILEPEFQFITFYLWNFILIINVYFSFLLNQKKIKYTQQIRVPGTNFISENICPICLEKNINWKLPCNHSFHFECINKWHKINKSCPNCRTSLN